MSKESALAEFGRRVTHSRLAIGYTQREAARAAGINESHWSHFETGNRQPNMRNAIAIADALGVSLDYLLGRVERPDEFVPTYKKVLRQKILEAIESLRYISDEI